MTVPYAAMFGSHRRLKNRETHSQFQQMLRSPASPEKENHAPKSELIGT
jgi:hypothetical protein